MKLSMQRIALAAIALTLAGALLFTGCGNDQQPSGDAGDPNNSPAGGQEQEKPQPSEKEDKPAASTENVVFAATNTPMDQETYGENIWIHALLRVTNLSDKEIALNDFLTWDEFMTKADRYGDHVEDLYRDQTAVCKSVTVRTATGEIPCIMVLENGTVSKTLPAGQSIEVWLTTLAPAKNRVLNISYKGVHQVYLYYGEGTASGGGNPASSVASSAASSAASEVSSEIFVAASSAGAEANAASDPTASIEPENRASR